jgi:hypothetical protein
MEINLVDPRDQTWEIDQPRYRVYFHGPAGASDEREITGADVAEVIAWVDSHRDARTYVLYVRSWCRSWTGASGRHRSQQLPRMTDEGSVSGH